MDIATEDHPPITQRPYNLPVKHAQWVKDELQILQKAGYISRSISPWSIPIVIVPKRPNLEKNHKNDCLLTIQHLTVYYLQLRLTPKLKMCYL